MDHGVGGSRRFPDSRKVVKVAAPDRGSGDGERGCRRVGSRETDNLMTRAEEFGDKSGADVAGGASDENKHVVFLSDVIT
jgi:hypothetical protein